MENVRGLFVEFPEPKDEKSLRFAIWEKGSMREGSVSGPAFLVGEETQKKISKGGGRPNCRCLQACQSIPLKRSCWGPL